MPAPPVLPPDPDAPSRLRAVGRYSGLAFQMLAIIGAFTWLGVWLDGRYSPQTPWFTVGLMLVGVFLAMFQIIRGLTKGS